MSDSSSQSEEKPEATNFRLNNEVRIKAQNVYNHWGRGDNITSGKGITMS